MRSDSSGERRDKGETRVRRKYVFAPDKRGGLRDEGGNDLAAVRRRRRAREGYPFGRTTARGEPVASTVLFLHRARLLRISRHAARGVRSLGAFSHAREHYRPVHSRHWLPGSLARHSLRRSRANDNAISLSSSACFLAPIDQLRLLDSRVFSTFRRPIARQLSRNSTRSSRTPLSACLSFFYFFYFFTIFLSSIFLFSRV